MRFRVFGDLRRRAQFFNHFNTALRLFGFGGFVAETVHERLQMCHYALVLGGGEFGPFYGRGAGAFVRIVIAVIKF